MNADLEVAVGVEDRSGVIDTRAGIENGQRALAEEAVDAPRARFTELLHFALGEGFEGALGAYGGVDGESGGLYCFHVCDSDFRHLDHRPRVRGVLPRVAARAT
ncbi:hypothetical protein D9M72_633560 [compost metagenome]